MTARGRTIRGRRGFTLLELMVAMALVAIIALSLYSSLGTAFKARRVAGAVIAQTSAAEIAMQILRDDIQNALPPTGILAGAFLATDGADGDVAADTVEFYATGPSGRRDVRQETVNRIDWLLEPEGDAGGHMLVREVTSNLLAPVAPAPYQEVLCRSVLNFNVRYFDGTQWQDQWDSGSLGDLMPTAVEVHLEFETRTDDGSLRTYAATRVFAVPAAQAPSDSVSTVSGGSGAGGGGTP